MSDKDDENTADLEALKALQADAQELDQIENLHDRFNVFEAIGFVSQEVMHSRFLAFLLDPRQNHAERSSFLRGFLQKVSESIARLPLSQPFDKINDRELDQTTVGTEVYTDNGRIDILLLNEAGEWAIIIENKIWSTERSSQLSRYYEFVKESYPGWQIFGIYLTPFGDAPSHESYVPLSYRRVCEAIDSITTDEEASLSLEVRTPIEQYADMIRRNIVGDFKVSKLSREIYQKHHKAIRLMLENLMASQDEMHSLLRSLIRETPRLTYGYRETEDLQDWIVFDQPEWNVPPLQVGEKYRNSHRLLYFLFYNSFPESLEIWLELGPGDDETRNRLFDMARRHPKIFSEVPDALSEYTKFYKRSLLKSELFERLSDEERDQEIRNQWSEFLHQDLPQIEEALKKETWIWEPVETDNRT